MRYRWKNRTETEEQEEEEEECRGAFLCSWVVRKSNETAGRAANCPINKKRFGQCKRTNQLCRWGTQSVGVY
jgi:hypothetical protein